ncbi:Platelet endothelial cell adhesion molecule [Collichthys lucidus]|uniref:Platelet endothelial cell adhesion molecule n=1 Tax=Collichthys lucidus TaxID=240159 RepID=A0A4U5VSU7_COLLU|nr:Platelet endothelial cell adhesion molecule [Collichthys lucidus]
MEVRFGLRLCETALPVLDHPAGCEVQKLSGDTSGRSLSQHTGPSVLINSSTTTEDKIEYEINPARAADSGSYECRVTVKDKSRASFSQKLTVTGLQTPVLYLNKTTPYESEEFVAACSAPDEKGVLIFRFYQKLRFREPKTIKQQAVTGNSLKTTLALREVGDSLLYCDYEISLVSGARRSNSSDEIQVIVKVHVSKPVLSVVGGTLILGKPFQLLCHSDNGTLPITYVLYIPKQPPLYSVVHKPGERAIFNRGTLPINFTWYHRKGALAFQTSRELKGSYTINNIKGVDQGEYYLKWAGWKKGLIATFCILFILAMILFLTFKRRLLPVRKKKTTGTLSVKSSGTKMERLSLTQTEVSEPANESDDQNSVTTPQQPEPQYTEVQTRQADPNRAVVKKGTDTVYSEVRNSKQGAPEQADWRE